MMVEPPTSAPESTPSSPTSPHPKDLKSRLKASYDAIAPAYNKWTLKTNHNIRLEKLDRVISHLTRSKRPALVLELGCGAGIPATERLISYPNISVTANDLSSTQIAIAKDNLSKHTGFEKVHFVESDMMSLNLPIQAFDAIVAFYSIIHLPRKEQTILIHRIARWLKPGGYFLANFSEDEFPGSEENNWLGEENGWMFWSSWGGERTIGVIEEAGLIIEERDVQKDDNDGRFLWVLARRKLETG
jgi:ubiquinone/menaquinone biosynthesis C-methylase UbiE